MGLNSPAGADQRDQWGRAIRGAGRCRKAINPQFPWKPRKARLAPSTPPGKGQEPPPPAQTPQSPSPTPERGACAGGAQRDHSTERAERWPPAGQGQGAAQRAPPCLFGLSHAGCSQSAEGCSAGANPASPVSSSSSESCTQRKGFPGACRRVTILQGAEPPAAHGTTLEPAAPLPVAPLPPPTAHPKSKPPTPR